MFFFSVNTILRQNNNLILIYLPVSKMGALSKNHIFINLFLFQQNFMLGLKRVSTLR